MASQEGQTPTAPDVARQQWRSPLLGEPRELTLSQGRLQYFERGRGPTLVFAHGWVANANLWRKVVDHLADRFRCLTLDLPLGAHRIPMNEDADLTPEGVGALIVEALEAMDVDQVTLVGNDSGGAYSQIATSRHADRVGRLALTSCETPGTESWPPVPFDALPQAVEQPGAREQLFGAMRDREALYSPLGLGLLVKRPIDDAVSDSYVLPCLLDDDVWRDTRKVMSSASVAIVREAAGRLIAEFHRPVLLAWGPDDQVFPLEHAQRYAEQLEDARVELIEDSYSFTPEDQPEALAQALARFAA